jgi:hypothetical protein
MFISNILRRAVIGFNTAKAVGEKQQKFYF